MQRGIAFKFGTEFHHLIDDTLQMFNVKGQRSKLQCKVMYQQQKRYNTAMDRFTDVKLGMASLLKREKAGVARVASSYNPFAIATFLLIVLRPLMSLTIAYWLPN